MSDNYEWLTVKELAKERGVTERTVRAWIRKEWVEARRTTDGDHGHWRIKVSRLVPLRAS